MRDFRQIAHMMSAETLMHFAEHGKSWERPICKSVIRERVENGQCDMFDALECERIGVL
jgi:hypothetical protein